MQMDKASRGDVQGLLVYDIQLMQSHAIGFIPNSRSVRRDLRMEIGFCSFARSLCNIFIRSHTRFSPDERYLGS